MLGEFVFTFSRRLFRRSESTLCFFPPERSNASSLVKRRRGSYLIGFIIWQDLRTPTGGTLEPIRSICLLHRAKMILLHNCDGVCDRSHEGFADL